MQGALSARNQKDSLLRATHWVPVRRNIRYPCPRANPIPQALPYHRTFTAPIPNLPPSSPSHSLAPPPFPPRPSP